MLYITVHDPLHRIPLHCSTLHYIHTYYMNTWIHEYMNTWIHEYMNAWTHEYIHTYTHTHLLTYMHACNNTMQCPTIPYRTLRYVTWHYIYYMIWHNITKVAFITWHRYTHTYIYYTHVCVEHLNRCKTSTWWCWFLLFVWLSFFLRDALPTSTAGFNFNFHFRAGGGCMVWQSSTNEDTAFPWWYDEGTPLSRTCFIFGHGMWLTQEPPSRFISFHVICLRPLFKQFSNQTRTDEFQVNVRWEWFDSCIWHWSWGWKLFEFSRVFSPTHSCQV